MAVSQLEVLITGNAAPLQAALAQGATAVKGFQSSMSRVATSAKSAFGTAVPLGAAAAGLAVAAFAKQSVESAVAFDRAFTQIGALTNTSAGQIDGLKQTVMDLSGQTAQSPVELAQAMYFLASAGLDATQQMEALDASAKGAAVGLGSSGDLARITANALNVFADNGLKASDVMDTLAAAVREGSAEPDEFANALGRVLPIADAAGISFQQVAASLATMSNAGLDVNEGVTALRGTLQALVAPTIQTQKALQSIGLTVDDVVKSMQQQGLIETLRMLSDRTKAATSSTGEYNITMRNLVPNVRALTGVLNLTGQEASKVDQIYRAVADSAGFLAKAFDQTAASPSFRIKQAFQEIANAGQQLAAEALPAIADALGIIAPALTKLLPLAIRLGEVWVGYKIVAGIEGFILNLAAAQVKAAAAATAEAAAEARATGALQLYGATAEEAALVTQQLAGAQGTAGASGAVGGLVGVFGKLNGVLAAATAAYLGWQLGQKAAFAASDHGIQTMRENIHWVIENEKSTRSWQDTLQHITDLVPEWDDNVGILIAGVQQYSRELTGGRITQDEFNQALVHFAQDDDPAKAGERLTTIISALTSAQQNGALSTEHMREALRGLGLKGQEVQVAMGAVRDAMDQQAAAMQKASEESVVWQDRTAQLTAKFSQLGNIGIDTNAFLTDFRTKLEQSDDPMATFQEGLASIQQAAADWRAQTSDSITGVGDVLGTLADKANLSTGDIHEAFQAAAEDARNFSADLRTIADTSGATGKALANALLQGGPAFAGLADEIASASGDTRKQLVSDFGDILAAGDTGASKLQQVLVPVLKNIGTILRALAREWGIHLQDNAPDTKRHVDDLHHSLQDLPPKTVMDIKTNALEANQQVVNLGYSIQDLPAHTVLDIKTHVHGSDLPDEVLRKHLFDPMKRGGFKRVGDRWTLPLDVGMHSSVAPVPAPGVGGGLPDLHRLIQVEIDNRGILKDIRQSLKHMDAIGGGHGGTGGGGGVTGSVSGSGGTTGTVGASLDDAVHRVVKLIGKFATTGEGVGVVKRVAQEGSDAAFIKKSVAQVADELGKHTAALYGRALRKLDDATLHSDAKRAALIKAALEAQGALKAGQHRDRMWWLDYATKNIPTLPAGHTNIDVNRHNRDERWRRLYISRPHMDDQLAYQEAYRGY